MERNENMNIRTEKAIKAWLKLPIDNRGIRANTKGQITLFEWLHELESEAELIARFTIASIVAKRGPKRKKRKLPKNNPGRVD